MRKLATAAAVLVAVTLAAPAATAATGGPRCPENAPDGAVYIRTVQPPFGLAYDEYRLPSGRIAQVYC